jgi:hypothetical protein
VSFFRSSTQRFKSIRRRLAALATEEHGFAIPSALLITIAASSVATIGVISTIRAEQGTSRDRDTKSAFQVAEAGINDALLRYNRYPPAVGSPCSPVGGTSAAGGWCGPVTGQLDGETFTYYVRAPVAGAISVVSSATVDGATRRVAVAANSVSDQPFFGEWNVQSHNDVHLDSNSSINSSVASNGSIILDSNSSLCGNSSHGPGESVVENGTGGQTCGTQEEGQIVIPPVNQGDAPFVNDNSRLFSLDLITGSKNKVCFDGHDGDNDSDNICGERHLHIQNNTSLTLGGSKYSFCKLTMESNTNLYIQSGKTVTIYFDSPENCGYTGSTTQLEMSSNARITGTNGSPASAALLFVGSPVIPTAAILSSNTAIGASCQQNFIIYGPFTDVTLNSNTSFCGAIAANSLEMDSNAEIKVSSGTGDYVLPGALPHYAVSSFIECAAAAAGPNTSGC